MSFLKNLFGGEKTAALTPEFLIERAKTGDLKAIKALTGLFEHEDTSIRIQAIRTYAGCWKILPNSKAFIPLIDAIHDENAEVSKAACKELDNIWKEIFELKNNYVGLAMKWREVLVVYSRIGSILSRIENERREKEEKDFKSRLAENTEPQKNENWSPKPQYSNAPAVEEPENHEDSGGQILHGQWTGDADYYDPDKTPFTG